MLIGGNWNNVHSHMKSKFRNTLYYSVFHVALHYFFCPLRKDTQFPNSKFKVKFFYVVGSTQSYQIPSKNWFTKQNKTLRCFVPEFGFSPLARISNYFPCSSEQIFQAKKSSTNIMPTTAEDLWYHKQSSRTFLFLIGRPNLSVCWLLFVNICMHCFGILCSSSVTRGSTHHALGIF